MIFGLGALILPWSFFPQRIAASLENWIGLPKASLQIPLVQGNGSGADLQALERKAIDDIKNLTASKMEGRRAGTTGETRALIYIENELKQIGLKPMGKDQYLQLFSFPPMEERVINGRALFRPVENGGLHLPSANVLGGLIGKSPDEYVIISAHYDHLGYFQGKLCPGANDNASGCGCVLEIMRHLAKEGLDGRIPKKTIIAAFWSAEEMGYIGSEFFVENPTVPLNKIKAVINFDTIGNGESNEFILWSSEKSSLIETAKKAVQKNEANLEYVSGNGHHSDEISFQNTGIPAVTILSKDWLEKNHTPSDNISLINQDKLDRIITIGYELIKTLAY
jgi:Zn-dependent M28 family amino/carboxypeptidase